jgi:hypothetical protein
MSPEAVAAREKYFEEKRKKEKVTPTGVTNADIEIALRKFDGNIASAAAFVGMDSSAVRVRIYKNEHLNKVRQELVDEFVDLTESELKKSVKSGNVSAIIFVLKTLGKDRGYVEKNTLEHELGPNAVKNAANMIEAMRRGMQETPDMPLPPPRMITSTEDVHEGTWRVENKDDSGREVQTLESR